MAASILKLLGEKLRSYSRSSSLNVINVEKKSSSEGEGEGEGEYAKKLLFEMWAKSHGIVYESEEEKMKRFENFKDTLRYIKKRSEESIRHGLSLRLELTPYSDMTYEEFCSKCLGRRLILGESDTVTMEENKVQYKSFHAAMWPMWARMWPMWARKANEDEADIPDKIDWREKGAVGPVKRQGPKCGCCWAFAAIAAVEAVNQIATGKMVSLSEQELVDCDKKNNGCYGGFGWNAFEYIKKNGIHAEKDYPYLGDEGECKKCDPDADIIMIDGMERVPANDEEALRRAVAKQPVLAAVATDDGWHTYTRGLYWGVGYEINHEVLIVGYGRTKYGTDYWIVKNSAGDEWGKKGYMKIPRNLKGVTRGVSGIARDASYPVKKALPIPT